jgi:endonuclease-3 related protein
MKATEIYDVLYRKMAQQPWLEEWQESVWEIVYGGILVQNTSWANVAPSLMNLKRNFNFNPQAILALSENELQDQIRPSGFYTRKSQTIQNVLRWASSYHFSLATIRQLPAPQLRSKLLGLTGIGPETADYLMMYAFDHAGFITDKYSRRIFEWGGDPLPTNYDRAKLKVESELTLSDAEWRNFHAMIVNAGKIIKTQAEFEQEFLN